MKRTSVWLTLSAIALLAAIWYVNGPLQRSVSRSDPSSASRPTATSPSSPARSRSASAPGGSSIPGEPYAPGLATATGALPARSVAEIMSLLHDFAQTHAAYALAAAAADASAIEALVAEAQGVSRRGDRVALTSIFLSRYSEIDPRAAIEFIADSELESKPDLLYRVFEGWSKVDPDAAIAAAADLETNAEQQSAVAAILRAHADEGAGAVAMIMSRLVAAGVSGNPQLSAAIRSASGEPEVALAAAMALPRDQAAMLVNTIGTGWATRDPEAAFAYSRTMRDLELRRQLVNGIFYAWIDRDPEHVVGLLDLQLTRDERNSLINAGLGRLAQRDPARALALSQTVANIAYRETALLRTFRTWGDADPVAAAAALERIDSGNMAALIREVGPEYARLAPAAALEWAKRANDGQHVPEVIAAVARENLPLALDTVLSLPNEADRTTAVVQIAAGLAAEDVTAATGFWRELPTEHRAVAAQGIVATWAQTDPDRATDWVRSLPPGPDRQQALSVLLGAVGPSVSLTDYGQLLSLVESDELRDAYGNARISALVRNGRREQAAAELDRLGLSPEGHRRARAIIEDANPGR